MSKPYRPLDPRITIRPSAIEGLGVFAIKPIEAGESIGLSHVYDERFKDQWIRTPLGGFINHRDIPNAEAVISNDLRYVKTLRRIEVNEEITLKYSLYIP